MIGWLVDSVPRDVLRVHGVPQTIRARLGVSCRGSGSRHHQHQHCQGLRGLALDLDQRQWKQQQQQWSRRSEIGGRSRVGGALVGSWKARRLSVEASAGVRDAALLVRCASPSPSPSARCSCFDLLCVCVSVLSMALLQDLHSARDLRTVRLSLSRSLVESRMRW